MHSCFRICWNEWFCDVYNQIVIGVMHEEHWYSCSETRLQWEPTTWAQSANHLVLRMKVKVFWSISSTAEGKLQTKQPNRENNLIACNSDSLKIEKSGLVIFFSFHFQVKIDETTGSPLWSAIFFRSIMKSIVCNYLWQHSFWIKCPSKPFWITPIWARPKIASGFPLQALNVDWLGKRDNVTLSVGQLLYPPNTTPITP